MSSLAFTYKTSRFAVVFLTTSGTVFILLPSNRHHIGEWMRSDYFSKSLCYLKPLITIFQSVYVQIPAGCYDEDGNNLKSI